MILLIIVIIYLVSLLFLYTLCVAASREDMRQEKQHKEFIKRKEGK